MLTYTHANARLGGGCVEKFEGESDLPPPSH